jgi:site-specific recombinase XerD
MRVLEHVQPATGAFFVNQRGGRLWTWSNCAIIAELGVPVRLEISPHTLRHSFVTNLVRQCGADLILVGGLLGHSHLESTRLYSLPSRDDRERVVATLPSEG